MLAPLSGSVADRYQSLKIRAIERTARELIDMAAANGLVLRIDLVPLEPLAMGNYLMVPSVRPARSRE